MSDNVAIIGGGFVGITVGVLAAKKGFNIRIIDIDRTIVEKINSKDKDRLHLCEKYVYENWDAVKNKIEASIGYEGIEDANYIIVAVQTPRIFDRIDYSPINKVAERLSRHISPNTLVSLESTIYPGGTVDLLGRVIEAKAGMKLDEDLYLVNVPERINPDDKNHTIEFIPRVLGGVGPRSLANGVEFYHDRLGLNVQPVDDIRIAEASKLLENSFRLLNISFMNELKRKFDADGLDLNKVIKACSTKPFGFMRFLPGPYVGGPCISKDSLMLAHTTESEMLRKALEINDNQPRYYARKIEDIIQAERARKVLFYGMGFKPGSRYDIDSPVHKIASVIDMDGLEIRKYDPNIPERSDFEDEDEALKWADLILSWGYPIGIRIETL